MSGCAFGLMSRVFTNGPGSPNLGQTTRPYDNLQKRENLQNCGLSCPADHRVKLKEGEKRDNYLDLARELKKLWNMKVTIIPIVIGPHKIGTRIGGLGNNGTRGGCPNYSIIENGQNTEKSPGDIRRLAVT